MAGAPSACAPTPCPPGQALDSRTRVLAAHAPSVCRPSPNHFALLTPFPHSSCLLLFLAKEKWTSASGSAVCSVTMDAMRREPALRHGLACRGGAAPTRHSPLCGHSFVPPGTACRRGDEWTPVQLAQRPPWSPLVLGGRPGCPWGPGAPACRLVGLTGVWG